MTSASQQMSSGGTPSSVARFVDRVEGLVRAVAVPSLVQLVLRFALATPFWRSGILKWDGFLRLNDTAVTLFTDEFMLHLPGGPYPFPAPAVMAFLSGCAEITFPILLVLGLATRFAALGLLFMTLVVELTVPDGWPIHITWAAMALAIMAWGPGRVSLDFLDPPLSGTAHALKFDAIVRARRLLSRSRRPAGKPARRRPEGARCRGGAGVGRQRLSVTRKCAPATP